MFDRVLVALAAMTASLTAEAEPPVVTMALENGALTGPGAALLLDRLPTAQFIQVGEDHGFADSPEIALALAKASRKYGVVNHVIEEGPILTGGPRTDCEKAASRRWQPICKDDRSRWRFCQRPKMQRLRNIS